MGQTGSSSTFCFTVAEKSGDLEDPDLVTPEVIDDILEKELGRRHQSDTEGTK